MKSAHDEKISFWPASDSVNLYNQTFPFHPPATMDWLTLVTIGVCILCLSSYIIQVVSALPILPQVCRTTLARVNVEGHSRRSSNTAERTKEAIESVTHKKREWRQSMNESPTRGRSGITHSFRRVGKWTEKVLTLLSNLEFYLVYHAGPSKAHLVIETSTEREYYVRW